MSLHEEAFLYSCSLQTKALPFPAVDPIGPAWKGREPASFCSLLPAQPSPQAIGSGLGRLSWQQCAAAI